MKFFKKSISSILAGGLILSSLSMGVTALTVQDEILENWNAGSAKYSRYTYLPITVEDENGDSQLKTEGFEFSVDESGGLDVTTPTFEEFAGFAETTVLTSNYKTPLEGLYVKIDDKDFDFSVSENGLANHISLIWSEDRIKPLNTDDDCMALSIDGLRNLIATNEADEDFVIGTAASAVDPEKLNGKALCVDITNSNTASENTLVASDVKITYYDGYYVDPDDGRAGCRWVFTARHDESGITQEYEEIDISNGLNIYVKTDEKLGLIVNINGKDYCYAEDVAYFGGMQTDIDLNALTDSLGYLTIGAVGNNESSDYTVTSVNGYAASEWKGEPKLPLLDNWTMDAAKFSNNTGNIIAPNGIVKTVGFTAEENEGAISVTTPDYESFNGSFGTSVFTSKATTALDGLNVYIKPDDFNFNMNDYDISNHISLLWSESKPESINAQENFTDLANDGFRAIIDEASGGKALCIDITNRNGAAENLLTASDVRITYYDGSYIGELDLRPGYRWIFTERNDGIITQNFESIDISEGLHINVREDSEYGFIVNINGKDYCDGSKVAYYDENIGAKVDLNGLSEAGEGYLTVGAVSADKKSSSEIKCDYSIVSVNGYAAAAWKGEGAPMSLLENWNASAGKFSSLTNLLIVSDGQAKTDGFKFNEANDNEVLVKVPGYEAFPGSYATTWLTSKEKTALDGLKVCIEPGDFDFALDDNGISNNISLIWSEGGVKSIEDISSITDLGAEGLRGIIDTEGGKALCIDLSNSNASAEGKLTASDVRITYYDGSYVNAYDGKPGYRWVFTERNDDIVQSFEEIDITNGLEISVRRDSTLGYIVNINGKDYCNTDEVAYFENAMTSEKSDIDLSGLCDVSAGYLTVGVVCNGDTEDAGSKSYIVSEVNSYKAAAWKGEKTAASVSAEGVGVTVKGLYNVRDYFIAKGVYDNYGDVKANQIVRIGAAKLGNATEYTYLVPTGGEHTVLIRYNDGTIDILYINIEVIEPTFSVDGLQLTLGNLEGIKVVRTAYGEYTKVSEIKRAEGARAFTAKYIKDTSAYTVQYRESGIVTVAVCYENGYTVIEHIEIAKKVPEMTQEANKITFSGLDGLKVLRYAKGEYETSAEIKRADGSVALTSAKIVDGEITVTLSEGTYSFCVQYDDESYNYYRVVVE